MDLLSNASFLLAILAVIGFIAAVYFLLLHRKQRQQLLDLQFKVKQLQHSLVIFDDGSQGIGRRLVAAEKQLKLVLSDQSQFRQQASQQIYTDAAELVAAGLTVDQILSQSDISRAEVELMVLLRDKPSH
tara:strand:- start:6734 stop:7123 length:390 start_codon:yes stop_codon:yes gene_type:complete